MLGFYVVGCAADAISCFETCAARNLNLLLVAAATRSNDWHHKRLYKKHHNQCSAEKHQPVATFGTDNSESQQQATQNDGRAGKNFPTISRR
jgi:hypothetical protein